MERLVLTLGCWSLLVGSVFAQQPASARSPLNDTTMAEVTPTPTESMWLYMQEMRRYDDPRQAVRRNAEARAEQRRARIAAAKWLGYSKQRPTVRPTPTTSIYGPQLFVLPVIPYGYSAPMAVPRSTQGASAELFR